MTRSMPILRLLTLAFFLATSAASAQTLARPGWAGSGMNIDFWWKHAVLYQVNPATFSPSADGTPIHGLTQRLDYIRSLGVDALLLTPIQPDAAHAQEINPALGTLDDLDDLIHEASRRNLRILLDLDPAIPSADLPNTARFWLNRGIAGFHVSGVTSDAHAQSALLRKTIGSYLGQRIVIADADPTLPPQPRQRSYKAPNPNAPQLTLDTRLAAQPKLTASTLRPALESVHDVLEAGHTLPLLATDGPAFTRSMSRYADAPHSLDIAKLLAAILFTSRAEPLLFYGQELGVTTPPTPSAPLIVWDAPPPPNKDQDKDKEKNKPAPPPDPNALPNAALEDADPFSLLNWYRRLSELHRGNATIAGGQTITLNHDEQNVLILVRKPPLATAGTPVLVIVCNLSAQPAKLSIKSELTKLHLRGSFLRTVLRSDKGMGTMHLESMTVPPYTAYIGELRY